MAWLNFSVMTIWSAMTPAGGMLPTWRRDDDKFVCGARAPVRHIIALEIMRMTGCRYFAWLMRTSDLSNAVIRFS
jgi:hypothetical protein